MNYNETNNTRRDILKTAGAVAAAATVTGFNLPQAFAAQDDTIQIAIVGCGGRGSGAMKNALNSPNGPVKIVAMADVFENRLQAAHNGVANYATSKGKGASFDVPPERQYIGFDAYKKAMDALRPGDVVVLATPPAFRWVQFTYAIERGLNVFMEKPVAVDAPSSRRMLELGKKAAEKNLKVGVGLMCRHCEARGELRDRIADGQIGDLITLRAYRMAGPTASAFSKKNDTELSDLMYQIRRFHSFLWLSGGAFSDFLIHNLDEMCWMKGEFPISAKASGGRHYRGDYIDQNFDSYSIEYTFADGTKAYLEGRTMSGCHNEFATYAHGSKGSAIVSTSGHVPAKSRIFKGHNMVKDDQVWAFGRKEPNPYDLEWDDLLKAIRTNQAYNEVERGTMASLACVMGRMSAHTGRIVTLEQLMKLEHEFAPNVDKLTLSSDAPIMPNANGEYPIPMPGLNTKTEYPV